MNEAWAAITAGVIAAAAGGIGLVMTKENKTSEFRQAWIQDLRLALTTFSSILLTVRNLSAEGHLVPEGDKQRVSQLLSEINLRINYGKQSPEEKNYQELLLKCFKKLMQEVHSSHLHKLILLRHHSRF